MLGYTRSGKTTVGQYLAEDFAGLLHSGSTWVKTELAGASVPQDKDEYVSYVTKYSKRRLRDDPEVASRFMKQRSLEFAMNIYEGVRNPNDFVRLYDPRRDLVIFLTRYESMEDYFNDKPVGPATEFEELGLSAIRHTLLFNQTVHETTVDRMLSVNWYKSGSCENLGEVYDRYIEPWVTSHVMRPN